MEIHTSKKSNLEKFFYCLLNFGKFICLLPLSSESAFALKVLHSFGCFISTINNLGILILFILTAYKSSHEKILFTELLGIILLYSELLFNILLWQFKRKEFQKFLQEFKDFFVNSEEHKRRIMNKYFNRYKYFYTFLIIFTLGTFLLRIIIAPILQRRKIPSEIYYPFIIKLHSATHYIVFCSQSIAAFHCSAQIIFPMIVALMFLHAVIKLELLIHNLKHVKNHGQLTLWIQQHLDCIQHVERINQVLGILIMKSYIISGLSIIFGSIKFIYNPNIYIIIRTFVTISSLLIGTYIYNGPADDIYEMNQEIRYTLYDMEWNEELMEMKKAVIIIMTRVQKPIFISPLKGLMPVLNRTIYTNFLSYLVSYIMTLRAIVNTQ